MQSGTVASNGIELFYESRGPQGGEPVVFIMGLSAQMVFWPEPLLDALVAQGYRVIRFDNRDVGQSSRIRKPFKQGPLQAIARHFLGLSVESAYTLHDLVDDTVGLLDALDIDKAHLVGASMGGMIGQLMAAHHPDRVRSLTSIMSSTNSPYLPPPRPQALKTLVAPRVKVENEDQFVAFGLEMMAKLAGNLPQDAEQLESMYRQSWQRGINPRGVRNQFMAVMATGRFTRQLKRITCPTVIIHGSADPLLHPAGGKASARAIPGARLHLIPGMGHDFPPSVMHRLAELIIDNVTGVSHAESAARAS